MYHLVGRPTGEADNIPLSIQVPYGGNGNTSLFLDSRNGSNKTLYSVIMGGNTWGTTANKIKIVGQEGSIDMPTQMPERGYITLNVTKPVTPGELIQVLFVKE